MRIVDFPACNCEESIQNLNHIFWVCPLLRFERSKMYRILEILI